MDVHSDDNSNKLLAALVHISSDAVILIDAAQSICVFNHGAEKIFGYTAVEVLSQPLDVLLPPTYQRSHHEHIKRFGAISPQSSRRAAERGRVKGLRKNGEEFDAEAAITHITLDGRDAYMVALRDVSEQIRQERTLRENQRRLQVMLDSETVYVGLLDPQGRVLYANRAALELLELRLDDVLGQLFWETPWWSDSPQRQQRLRTAFDNVVAGRADRFETQHPSTSRGYVDIDFILTPVMDEHGRVTAILPEGRDITERKRAEAARSASEARLQFVVSHSPDSIFIQDTDLRYRWVADSPRGITANRQLGSTDLEYAAYCGIDGIESARITAIKREVLATGQMRSCEVSFNFYGEARHFEAFYEPIRDAKGQVTGLLGYERDRTKEHVNMRLLEEARQLAEHATKTKSRFLAVASHDLRQPLQTAVFLAGTLSRLIKDPDSVELIEQLRRTLVGATELLNTLLDVSKLDSGTLQPVLQSVPLATLFVRLGEEFSEAAKAKRIRLIAEPISLVIKSDPQWLRQILQNLLANALRYTPESGTITLRACATADATVIEVADSGVGIPADKIEHIFDEFYQIGVAGKERRGWGLGLSIVKHAAKMLGHEVHVESTVGKGSVFTVHIAGVPLTDTAHSMSLPAHAATKSVDAVRQSRVLIIDDDQGVASATKMLLKVEGFEVDIANGSEDLNRLLDQEDFAPEVIVSDVQLGEAQTGPDLVRIVRERLHRLVPAVIVSGDTSSLHFAENLLPSSRILNKPISADELLTTLNSLIGDRREHLFRV